MKIHSSFLKFFLKKNFLYMQKDTFLTLRHIAFPKFYTFGLPYLTIIIS